MMVADGMKPSLLWLWKTLLANGSGSNCEKYGWLLIPKYQGTVGFDPQADVSLRMVSSTTSQQEDEQALHKKSQMDTNGIEPE